MNKRVSILLAGILCIAVPAVADEAAAGVAWDALDREAQALLAGQQERWASLPPEKRERWERMSPEERRRAISRRQGAKPGSVDKRPCPPC